MHIYTVSERQMRFKNKHKAYINLTAD